MHGGDIYSHKIKHDFSININPLGVPLAAKFAYLRALKKISNYPDQNCRALRAALSKKLDVPAENLVFGNGASELIQAVIHAVGAKRVLLFAPCFTGYERAVKACGANAVYFYLDEHNDFSLKEADFSRLQDTFQREKPDFVIFTNPNNPNGRLFDGQVVENIIQLCIKYKTKLLLDECFIELAGAEGAFSFVRKAFGAGQGIFIIRAFTKTYAIPGLRLGYCICDSAEPARALQNQLPEWNVSAVAQKVGLSLLKTGERYLKKAGALIRREREYLSKELKALGFKVYNSDANFILFKDEIGGGAQPSQVGEGTSGSVPDTQSQIDAPLPTSLLQKRILIRDCSDFKGLGEGFYRIAVKRHQENRRLIKAIKRAGRK